uniref:Uncharacterized protein n=1 Tax=Steinernema glaseri TaxID=37863 RepID=A0A1I7ZTR8_9BILA
MWWRAIVMKTSHCNEDEDIGLDTHVSKLQVPPWPEHDLCSLSSHVSNDHGRRSLPYPYLSSTLRVTGGPLTPHLVHVSRGHGRRSLPCPYLSSTLRVTGDPLTPHLVLPRNASDLDLTSSGSVAVPLLPAEYRLQVFCELILQRPVQEDAHDREEEAENAHDREEEAVGGVDDVVYLQRDKGLELHFKLRSFRRQQDTLSTYIETGMTHLHCHDSSVGRALD